MRLFIFAIGGTGSRVLKSLLMLSAAGVRPVGPDGKPVPNLDLVPIIIGKVIKWSNPGIEDPMQYNYTSPMLVFASFGVLALFFGVYLKYLNKKNNYGLEDPGIRK